MGQKIPAVRIGAEYGYLEKFMATRLDYGRVSGLTSLTPPKK